MVVADVRGLDPQGDPRNVGVNGVGDLLVSAQVYRSPTIRVPGIGAAAAYVSGDAFGAGFSFSVPVVGTIAHVYFLDYDDEGIQKDLVLFSLPFVATADNSAFAVSDADLRNCVGVAVINTYRNFGNNQFGEAGPALNYVAPQGTLYAQLVTRGADNIAAGASPEIYLVIV